MLKRCLSGMGMLIVSLILQAQKGSDGGSKYTMFVLTYVPLRAKFIDVCKVKSSENEIRLH